MNKTKRNTKLKAPNYLILKSNFYSLIIILIFPNQRLKLMTSLIPPFLVSIHSRYLNSQTGDSPGNCQFSSKIV